MSLFVEAIFSHGAMDDTGELTDCTRGSLGDMKGRKESHRDESNAMIQEQRPRKQRKCKKYMRETRGNNFLGEGGNYGCSPSPT